MSRAILGIDVSKATLYLALLEGKGKPKKRQVSNNAAGFALLDEWLKAEQVSPIHACLEATSTYTLSGNRLYVLK
ncbi:MAG: hypothetical protein LH679_01155 [Cyanobacteria bacterium CAN_BIN43]|nr:hypothetical protein [Cyanobacteria bacterium CAN_BIN43]